MNFIPSKFDDRYRPGPMARRCAATIGLSLAILMIAHAAMAKPATLSTPKAKPAQTIALKLNDESGQGTIASPAHNFRLLGYGLFLLQIGLIPLKLAKGNKVETMIFDRSETNVPD
jgi:hypothetical protein